MTEAIYFFVSPSHDHIMPHTAMDGTHFVLRDYYHDENAPGNEYSLLWSVPSGAGP